MHNPLGLFSAELLDALLASGHAYFVRQSYPRGKDHFDTATKESLLITPYREFTSASAHFQAIRFDERKHIYDMQHTGEKEKLYKAAAQPVGYKIFVALLKEKAWKPSPQLGPRIKNYLRAHTRWKPEHGEKIDVSLAIQFGELFLNLRYMKEQIKVPLADIEKI